MSETMYFKDGNTYWKAVWDDDLWPESPRVDRDNLGTMVFIKDRNYKLGDEQVSDFSEFFKSQIDEELKNELSDLTESQLYDKWAETKAAVVPIDVYEHSEITCHAASVRKSLNYKSGRDEGWIYNNGFVYVDKDNVEFQNELKGEARDINGNVYNRWPAKSEEEAKKWAENVIKAEIEDYARYLEGDVHTVTTASFNPSTLEWESQDFECGILGDTLENNLKFHGFNIDKVLGQNEVFVLENTANPEFKKAVIAEYFNDVKAELSDFNNDVLFSSKSVLKQWKAKANVSSSEPEHDSLNRWELKRQVIEDYLKKSNCQSPENLRTFLNENIEVKKPEKEIEPLSLMKPGAAERKLLEKVRER